ncbi:hypothetical protein K4K54_004529 [Colletotrichum sp. SAR 10_86]|nr:hypothetical protein K4K52_009512 [Colletotrichum sp. SAR 10_76]KAI8236093.1 hypothetical protein K4K54_004529 [Colletotrichum sp. SAR 10_86]
MSIYASSPAPSPDPPPYPYEMGSEDPTVDEFEAWAHTATLPQMGNGGVIDSRADRSMQSEDQLGLSTSSNLFPNLVLNQWQTPGMPGSSMLPSTDVHDITIEAKATFDAEYHSLFRQDTAQKTKEHIFGVVCDKVLPYRAQEYPRLFPPVMFYDLLCQNDADRARTAPLARRCAAWFHDLTIEQADHCVARILRARQDMNGRSNLPERQPQKAVAPKRSRSSKSSLAMDHQHPVLATELAKAPTMTYREIIKNSEDFEVLSKAYSTHIRKEKLDDVEKTDDTWPITTQEELMYVKQAVMAIYDTTEYVEKTAALQKKARIDALTSQQKDASRDGDTEPRKKRKLADATALKTDSMGKKIPKLNPVEAVLASPEKSPREQLKAIIRHELKDFEVAYLG